MIQKQSNPEPSPGMLVKGKGYLPAAGGTIIYFETDDIQTTLARIVKAGGSIIFPKKPVPPHGYIAWFADTEGNTIGLHGGR